LTSERLATVEEHLSYYHILPKPVHTSLTHISPSVILHLDDEIDREIIAHSPLAPYATWHWVEHDAQFKNVLYHRTSRRSWGIYLILDSHILQLGCGYTTLIIIGRCACPRCIRRSLRLGHFIMPLCGFIGFAEHLIAAHSKDVNSEGGSHTTPLHAASVKGHLASLLLRSGADPDSCDHLGRFHLIGYHRADSL
jgi:hypothetical protein